MIWRRLLNQYWRVVTFKHPPSETPYSLLLLMSMSLFYFFLVVVQWKISDIEHKLELGSAFIIAGGLIASYFVYTGFLLWLYRFSNRYVQTLTSLISAHALIHGLAFPLLFLTPLLVTTNTLSFLGPFVAIIYLVFTLIFTIWQFAVTVYVYKSALTVDYLPAILASLGLLACNILMVSFLR